MQHFLKRFAGAAGARIIATEFFDQLFVAMDDARAALDVRFRWEAVASFTGCCKSKIVRRRFVWFS